MTHNSHFPQSGIDIPFSAPYLCGQRFHTMPRFIVSALSEDTIAAPGNRQPNYITVSVSDEATGAPVSGLTANNFKVDPMIVGPGGGLVSISGVSESSRISGFYFVNVVPLSVQTWKAGVYIFAVAVSNTTSRGQALCSVLMD